MIRKGITLVVILLFIGVSIIPSSTSIEKLYELTSSGKTLYVGGSGPGNYTSIQDAIDNSSNGDTVFVYNGTYYENINIVKSINLIGEDKNSTVIDGSYIYNEIVYILWGTTTITGFTIQNSQRHGISIDGCNVSGGDTHRNTIYGNIIKDTDEIGIVICASWRNNIYRNNITNHSLGGIYIVGFAGNSLYNSIYQNNIMDNDCGISIAPSLNGNAYDNIIYQNNFFNNRKNTHDITTNQWDNGKEGNYWDDYKGKDMDDDGIGDKPYRIRPRLFGNKDNYPLMKPYGNVTSYPKNSQSITTSNKQINKNNIPIGILQFNNDTTPPEIKLYFDYFKEKSQWYIKFIAKCRDNESGMDRVEFYINNGLSFIDDTEPFEWTFQWSEDFRKATFMAVAYDKAGNSAYNYTPERVPYNSILGIILNPKISEKNITFFAIIVIHSYICECGLPSREIFKYEPVTLIIPKDYDGNIRRFFISVSYIDW